MSSSKRHFTVVMNSKEHGLYISSTPSSAARKAVSKLCADNKKKKVEFYMRETTQGSNRKTYGPYLGEMKKLDKPIELKGRVIQYSVNVHLKKKKSTIKTSKKVGNKLRGGRIEDDGYLEAVDFIYPIDNLKSFDTKIKKKNNWFGRKQTCFFIVPKQYINDNERMYYKYAAYYSYKDQKIIIKVFDGAINVEQIDIENINDYEHAYDFLNTLNSILPSYPNESPDFRKKVEEKLKEIEKIENPYVKKLQTIGYQHVKNLKKLNNLKQNLQLPIVNY